MAEIAQNAVLDSAAKTSGVAGVSYRVPRNCSSVSFDPTKHLCFKAPAKRHTMTELGIGNQGISDIAVTEPFPLFTPEGVRALREDILSDRVLDDYAVSSTLAPCQAREFNSKVTPFLCAAWSSAEVTAAVSRAAGIELEPIMQLELGHTNYQAGDGSIDALRNLSADPSPPWPAVSEEERVRLAEENDISKVKQIVDWHFDAYPFVCVLMLSDTTTMLGGETALLCGDSSIRKVRGPSHGYAVVLQGRHVKHLACKAYNAHERITMVTSYRAKDPSVADLSNLANIRMVSKEYRLNHQWSLYRTQLLADRFQAFADKLRKKRGNMAEDYFPETITREEMRAFAQEQIEYLTTTYEEMM